MKIVPILALLLLTLFAQAQQNDLPKGLNPDECEILRRQEYGYGRSASGISTPPTDPIRTAAEWEEIQALTITWRSYPAVLAEIVRHARLECQVIVVCNDSNQVKTYLQNQNIALSNVAFQQSPSNSVWIRDYGMNTAYLNDVDSLVLVDWIYNRPRPADDAVPQAIADRLGLTLYETTTAPYELVHTGGNFMSDGMGTAFSSKLVLEENGPGNTFGVAPKTSAEIDSVMKKFMGINRYVKMDVLPYDGIHHIDMHMKLLDEETLLVGEYPAGVADGPQIEANLQYVLSNYTSPFGTPYKVVRVPMPPGSNGNYPDATPWWNAGEYRTYSNAVFVNKTLLVPVYEERYDTTGLRILRESLPGYNVVGINANDPIQASGAIHCITHSVGVSDPLWITHQPLPDVTYVQGNSYTVGADMKHRSGIQSARLYYRTDTMQPYAVENMYPGFWGDTWFGTIPDVGYDVDVYYYVEGTAGSGKVRSRPLTAPQGYWKFHISAPSVGVQAAPSVADELLPPYPNPARALTCVPLRCGADIWGDLTLVDGLGREVLLLHRGNFVAGDSNFFFDASALAAGLYFLRWQPQGQAPQYRRVAVR